MLYNLPKKIKLLYKKTKENYKLYKNISIYLLKEFFFKKILIIIFNTELKRVTDSVNQGISTVKKIYTACTIKLSINKDLKLKKRKGKDK